MKCLLFLLVRELSGYIARNSGLSSFSAMKLVWSFVHCIFTDLPCWLGGRNVMTQVMSSVLELSHGGVARGCILSVFFWTQPAMQDMHVLGVFLVLFDLLW